MKDVKVLPFGTTTCEDRMQTAPDFVFDNPTPEQARDWLNKKMPHLLKNEYFLRWGDAWWYRSRKGMGWDRISYLDLVKIAYGE